MAFFTIDCMSEGENNLLFTELALLTQNFASFVRYSDQSIALVFSKSSS